MGYISFPPHPIFKSDIRARIIFVRRDVSRILLEIASIKVYTYKCCPYRSMRSSSNGRRPSSTDTVTFNRGTRRRNFVSLRRLDEEGEEGPATLSTPSPLPFASISLRKPTRSLVEPRCERGYVHSLTCPPMGNIDPSWSQVFSNLGARLDRAFPSHGWMDRATKRRNNILDGKFQELRMGREGV